MSKYELEKYKGMVTRHTCPSCGKPKVLTRYVDTITGLYIDDNVGRCNRETSCAYHYTPGDYFKDNPGSEAKSPNSGDLKRKLNLIRKPGTIPADYVIDSFSYQSNFVKYLCSLFDPRTVERLMYSYYLGATKNGSVVYWQMCGKGIRTGKIMQYNPETGKRIKHESGAIDWIHNRLKANKALPDNFNLVQCLFGEHLLNHYPKKQVVLVESEKTAILLSGLCPRYIFLSCGGRTQLSVDKLKPLKDRTVTLIPDTDITGSTYALWSEKAKELRFLGFDMHISDCVEKRASDEDRQNGVDIADLLIRRISRIVPDSFHSLTPLNRGLCRLGVVNSSVFDLVNAFDLTAV